jgi:hypothetical protein
MMEEIRIRKVIDLLVEKADIKIVKELCGETEEGKKVKAKDQPEKEEKTQKKRIRQRIKKRVKSQRPSRKTAAKKG